MNLEISFYNKWYDNFKDYSVLSFINEEVEGLEGLEGLESCELENRVKRLNAILNDKKSLNYTTKYTIVNEKPGKDFEIYRLIIGSNPQPVPELKKYSQEIQDKFKNHKCWIEWAGIYDRRLTAKERKYLGEYRNAYLVFLTTGDIERASGVLKLAQMPFTLNLITMEYLYSEYILKQIMS